MFEVVVSSLVPVMVLIALGLGARRWQWVGPEGALDLSRLAFSLFGPALLFRIMSTVDVAGLVLQPVMVYFAAAVLAFWGVWWCTGRNQHALISAMSAIFGNTLGLGIPLVGYVFGDKGLVPLLTLIALHALVLVTMITVAMEWSLAHGQKSGHPSSGLGKLGQSLWTAVSQSLLHPVPLPIIMGLLFAQTGWVLPSPVEQTLQWLGAAFGPLALILVGVSLSDVWTHKIAAQLSDPQSQSVLRRALGMAMFKNFAHPALMAAVGWSLGLRGLPLWVMVVAAALPVGNNVFLMAQRYRLAQQEVSVTTAVSTVLGMVSLPTVLVCVQWLV